MLWQGLLWASCFRCQTDGRHHRSRRRLFCSGEITVKIILPFPSSYSSILRGLIFLLSTEAKGGFASGGYLPVTVNFNNRRHSSGRGTQTHLSYNINPVFSHRHLVLLAFRARCCGDGIQHLTRHRAPQTPAPTRTQPPSQAPGQAIRGRNRIA